MDRICCYSGVHRDKLCYNTIYESINLFTRLFSLAKVLIIIPNYLPALFKWHTICTLLRLIETTGSQNEAYKNTKCCSWIAIIGKLYIISTYIVQLRSVLLFQDLRLLIAYSLSVRLHYSEVDWNAPFCMKQLSNVKIFKWRLTNIYI